MSFGDLWKQVGGLPDMAMAQIPTVLSASTKMKLTKLSPDEIGIIVNAPIEEINRGSIETVDTLVKKRL